METEKAIWCVECKKEVQARLTTGKEIYPKRYDLHSLPFWICDECKNYVGCHHKTENRTNPLGSIPTPLLRKDRTEIHRLINEVRRISGKSNREIYKTISNNFGYEFHTGDIRTVEESIIIKEYLRNVLIPEALKCKDTSLEK